MGISICCQICPQSQQRKGLAIKDADQLDLVVDAIREGRIMSNVTENSGVLRHLEDGSSYSRKNNSFGVG